MRTHALDQMVQAVGASASLRVIKRVDQTLQELAVSCVLDAHKIIFCEIV